MRARRIPVIRLIASIIASGFSQMVAIGFSQKICFPVRAALITCSR
jgi:hypothetical protein